MPVGLVFLAAKAIYGSRAQALLGVLRGQLQGAELKAPELKVTLTHQTNRFPQLSRAIREAGQEAVVELAEELAEDWRSRVHVVTGAYRDSIHRERQGNTISVVADVPYAIYEEFGTVHRPGHPAFVPAVEAARHKLQGSVQKAIRDRLR